MMRLSTRCTIAAATAALCAALTGCGRSEADASDLASAAPSPSATQTADPHAINFVAYREYSDAARQTGIRPDLVAREFGFGDGLATLCRTTPSDLTALLVTLKSAAAAEENAGHGLQAMIDEVSLRMDMACPQRMSDWIAAGGGSEHPGDEGFAAETESGIEAEETGVATSAPTPASTAPSAAPSESATESATESSFGQASISDLSAADISDSGGEVRQYDVGDGHAAGSGGSDVPSGETDRSA